MILKNRFEIFETFGNKQKRKKSIAFKTLKNEKQTLFCTFFVRQFKSDFFFDFHFEKYKTIVYMRKQFPKWLKNKKRSFRKKNYAQNMGPVKLWNRNTTFMQSRLYLMCFMCIRLRVFNRFWKNGHFWKRPTRFELLENE